MRGDILWNKNIKRSMNAGKLSIYNGLLFGKVTEVAITMIWESCNNVGTKLCGGGDF